MSYFVISDGSTIKNFGTAQDHKRVNEGDTGKNTGLGNYCPSRLINGELDIIIDKIIKPTLNTCLHMITLNIKVFFMQA